MRTTFSIGTCKSERSDFLAAYVGKFVARGKVDLREFVRKRVLAVPEGERCADRWGRKM